jgi:hypothetical protein
LRYFRAATAALLILLPVCTLAQTKPQGTDVLNQAKQAAAITYGQDMTTTRGLYVGGNVACDIMALFANSTVAVPLYGLRPGQIYPFQLRRLTTTGTVTACNPALLIALW